MGRDLNGRSGASLGEWAGGAVCGATSAAKQFAEKLGEDASGAKALTEKKGSIAALKALRHPKSSFSANCKAGIKKVSFIAALKSVRENWVVPPGLESKPALFPALKRWAKLVRPAGAGFSNSSLHRIARKRVLTHTLKRCATQKQLLFVSILLLWVLPAGAQVAWGDLHADADGLITAGYAGAFGNLQTSDHSLTVGGNGTIKGYYYNPNFVNFSVQPFYDRAQSNAESLSIADNSGYNGNINFFSGSHFPGTVSFNQEWNGTGTFGIPGMAGLITNNRSHGFGIGWSALLPDLPTLSVGYSQGSTSSSLYGSDIASEGSHRVFDVSSSYVLAGFRLNGGFNHVTNDTTINGLVENGEPVTSDSSSNLYRINAVRALPFFNSQLSMGASRGNYSADFTGGSDHGTTDSANANLTVGFPKVPVSVYANYTDNLFGSIVQQQLGSGQEPTQTFVSPTMHVLTTGASAFYNVLPRMTLSGFVNHIEEYVNGESSGSTQLGGSVTYSFARRIQGLTFTAGMLDTATQQGNTRIGFIGSADYRKVFGRWETDSYFRYDQNTQTLFSIYTISTMNYGATVKRDLGHGLRWVGIATGSHSAFQQNAGDSSRGEGFTSVLFWRRMSVSGNYLQSKGTAVLTAGGLVGEPVPGQEIPADNLILYNGKSYGGSIRYNPIRSLGFTGSYSRSYSHTVSSTLLSNNSSTQVYGLATYRLRKLLFTAGVTNFRQSLSSSGTPPGVVTSYYFGVSRWFKGF